ncbi:MAG: zinc-dependent alcohol dehydrogenase family protein [Candidatus Hodarchaeales archaeon]|jgi:propanol-preferring alcohol dehydrogenase
MLAMVLNQFNNVAESPLEKKEIETLIPSLNEIRIKLKACGVCHTDLHIVEGELPNIKLPIVPGHEIVGKIDMVGDNVSNIKSGDRVGIAWLYSTCGMCKFCLRGLENLCNMAQFTGYDVNGGYAEYITISSSFVYKIPDNFEFTEAAPLMCAGIIGYRSVRLAGIQPDDPSNTIGLFGFGASAHIVIQLLKYWEFETYVFTRSKSHQDHASELGADWVGSSKDQPPKKIDRAITFAPSGPLILDVLRLLDKGGILAINAIHLSDIPPISWNLLWHERQIRSVANTTRNDAVEFLKIAKKIPIKTTINKYPLDHANQALYDMKHSNLNGAAVLTF